MDITLLKDLPIASYPDNLLFGACLILLILSLYYFARHSKLVKRLQDPKTSVIVLLLVVVALVIEGLTGIPVSRLWIFFVLVCILMLILGLLVVRSIFSLNLRKLPPLLVHLGFFIVLFAGSLGSPQTLDLKHFAYKSIPNDIAIDREGLVYELPFQIVLREFDITYYDDEINARMPKSYDAELDLMAADASKTVSLRVNHPAHFKGYDIYLENYDLSDSDHPQVQLKMMFDPWSKGTAFGIWVLLLGLVSMLFYKLRNMNTNELD